MGAECSTCGRDIYDECGYCAVVAERDHWIRLFNRLEAAISHHKKARITAMSDDDDDSLYAARDRILKAAAKGPQ